MGIAESRRIARELALFTIYCTKIKEKLNLEDCKKEVLSLIDEEELEIHNLDQESLEFFTREVDAYEMHKEKADEFINQHLERWEVERMNTLDLSILELAVCELIAMGDVGFKVTISEAVNLAKKYSSNRAPLLVNAVVDSICRTLGLRK
ncbi:MAG TPA: transcription antitermination factor NusB [Candidatus Hydrothermia bacterium]|nr:transcription antitermination factor NusB [Candidatus Hydrothermae bacterium]MDD3648657.1 transcription antitermination factor NusB [Candidatus Hydrothermia bacterium]MDD5572238.1 transcription antitermination factor NusB [Candidatus Hydrothermia bacterium]HOK22483.1 transcription antitermination factor NusB [Candidatus Hydrothermia bacterium]HOL23190.1 transcription antitermination factor NusB [Candidatus Hydrothermia bacterium]